MGRRPVSVVAAYIRDLDPPEADGALRFIRLGTYPDATLVPLHWNTAAGKWIGNPIRNLVISLDQNWLKQTHNAWAYLTQGDASGGVVQAANAIRVVASLAQLYAAGCRLQDRAHGRILEHRNGVMQVAPWFYQYNSGDPVVFSNDSAQNAFAPSPESIGRGVVLSGEAPPPGGGAGTVRFWSTAWTDVVFQQVTVNGGLSGTPIVPSKRHLYVTVYAQALGGDGQAGSTDAGWVAAYTHEMRWVADPAA
jgi:hypothetical protein